MKLIKIIMLTAIAIILTIQVAQAGSLLTGTSGSSGSLMNESYSGEVYDSSGNQMSCYTDSYGNTVCN